MKLKDFYNCPNRCCSKYRSISKTDEKGFEQVCELLQKLCDKFILTSGGTIQSMECSPIFDSFTITETTTINLNNLYNNITIDNQANDCDLIITLNGDINGNKKYVVRKCAAKNISFECAVIDSVIVEVPEDCNCLKYVDIDLTKTF